MNKDFGGRLISKNVPASDLDDSRPLLTALAYCSCEKPWIVVPFEQISSCGRCKERPIIK